jgi:hypothetical protein
MPMRTVSAPAVRRFVFCAFFAIPMSSCKN